MNREYSPKDAAIIITTIFGLWIGVLALATYNVQVITQQEYSNVAK
ncbi:hypothetical protein [Synechococcus phage S-N03]|uniref:Uncharacterized protein n=1 Tax=Synechococcus phage S-N03 TaxID=2718943 RepID=A0A6G8R5K4_9CAUD|nr:hypothetical protein PQC09_gp027 [Synechococcus phage S-N03]QIN96662.1 hypothetical protein [Synechococcus phage S-N03]